ncbi:MAG TPA: hypothetical protein VIY28_14950 [Pseudonocardiaceae bacterium]
MALQNSPRFRGFLPDGARGGNQATADTRRDGVNVTDPLDLRFCGHLLTGLETADRGLADTGAPRCFRLRQTRIGAQALQSLRQFVTGGFRQLRVNLRSQ